MVFDENPSERTIFPLVILIGVVLFFFPEPSTSIVGAILMVGGAIGWFLDYFGLLS